MQTIESGSPVFRSGPLDGSSMRCTWCRNDSERLTKDHVIPRGIGGTLDYALPSCEACQRVLSKAEAILARKSSLAIHAVSSDLQPRHPKRRESGVLRTGYLFVKNPLGGYGESILRAGNRVESLCHCEIKVVPGQPPEGRTRGQDRAHTELLFAKFKAALSKTPQPNGLICEINVSCDVPPEISADPDFWPRMVLLPNGNLLLRARDRQEAHRFISVFAPLVMSCVDAFRGEWQSAEISSGTQHQMMIQYDTQAVRRVAAKIAYGVFLISSGNELDPPRDNDLRAYVLGAEDEKPEPVTEAPESFRFTTGDTPYHQVVLGSPHDPEAAIVRLYGYAFRVDLGNAVRRFSRPIVVLCATDGSGMRLANAEETREILTATESLIFEPN